MRRLALATALLAAISAADDEGGDSAARIAAAKEVAREGTAAARKAIPELIALGAGSAAERFAARDALAVAGPPALPPLVEAAAKDDGLRLLLLGVSADLGAAVVAPALPLLDDEDPRVRACAARALGAAGPGGEAAVRALDKLLFDPDPAVRRAAAVALGGIGRGAREAVSGLIHLANDPERGATRVALHALGMIVRDAAERARRLPTPRDDIARALASGLAWLETRQDTDGAWRDGADDVTPVVLMALLGDREIAPRAAKARTGVRHLVTGAVPGARDLRRLTALCTAVRRLDEPECVAALQRTEAPTPHLIGWFALASLEARFAMTGGPFPLHPPEPVEPEGTGPAETALWLLMQGRDEGSDSRLRTALAHAARGGVLDPESWLFVARARWYAGESSDELAQLIVERQRADGSWDATGGHGPVFTTAVMLLCLETAAGLARPLELPLPDAPQLRAAVATLRLASRREDAALRAAAELALAGFRDP